MDILLAFFFAPMILILVDFISFLSRGKGIRNSLGMTILMVISEIVVLVIYPIWYADFGGKNDCCGHINNAGIGAGTALFSPDHQLTMAVIIGLCLVAYFYSEFRKKLLPPIPEIVVNCFLLIGIILNIFIAFHSKDLFTSSVGNLPIILSFTLMLIKNQLLFIKEIEINKENQQNNTFYNNSHTNYFEKIAWQILSSKSLVKFPILLVLCLPILVLLSAILLLFGQKPDAIIRAFTDTYRQGFSQWDYKCESVECPHSGHYLCSVAANGHQNIVKPKRIGIRHNQEIICNRQLLISNAFEDLIQEKMPFAHKIIRKNYDKIGVFVHKNYNFFRIKWICDVVYLLMKPLEWFFLLTLYIFDKKPENRIAKQYISHEHRISIENSLK